MKDEKNLFKPKRKTANVADINKTINKQIKHKIGGKPSRLFFTSRVTYTKLSILKFTFCIEILLLWFDVILCGVADE